MSTPERSFGPGADGRIARINTALIKYDRNEPRDSRGRWTTGGTADPTTVPKPHKSQTDPRAPAQARQHRKVPIGTGAHPPAQSPAPKPGPTANPDPHGLLALQRTLESKFDILGPVEFSKHVTQFGNWLEKEGASLNSEDRLRALSEYAFLQSRLEFWLGYKYIPPLAHSNLLSAASFLYQGATNSGLVHPGKQPTPRSFLAAGMAAMAFDGGPSGVGRSRRAEPELDWVEPVRGLPRLGGLARNEDIGIVWNGGIQTQGKSFEDAYERLNPDALRLPSESKTFDFYWEKSQDAVSIKTLNIVCPTYIRNPQKVLAVLKGYIDAAADYNKPRVGYDLSPEIIQNREIQLAIPEGASPDQIRYLTQAWNYSRIRGVNLEITSVR